MTSKKKPKLVHLHMRCRSIDKIKWKSEAEKRSMTLTKYIISKLNGGL